MKDDTSVNGDQFERLKDLDTKAEAIAAGRQSTFETQLIWGLLNPVCSNTAREQTQLMTASADQFSNTEYLARLPNQPSDAQNDREFIRTVESRNEGPLDAFLLDDMTAEFDFSNFDLSCLDGLDFTDDSMFQKAL